MNPRFAFLVAVLAAAAAGDAEAQAVADDGWQRLVATLSEGRSIRVETVDGRIRLGRSEAIDDSVLVMRVRSGAVETRVPRIAIRRVHVREGSAARTGLLIGSALGAAAASVAVAVSPDEFRFPPEGESSNLPFLLGSAALGAGLGAMIGSAFARYEIHELAAGEVGRGPP